VKPDRDRMQHALIADRIPERTGEDREDRAAYRPNRRLEKQIANANRIPACQPARGNTALRAPPRRYARASGSCGPCLVPAAPSYTLSP
jgi:hypothetical protein